MKATSLQPEALVILIHDADVAISEQFQSLEHHPLHIHKNDLISLSSASEVLHKGIVLQEHCGVVYRYLLTIW